MKKFVIHTLKGKTSFIEVECIQLTPMDAPSVAWLPPNEYKARIEAPSILFEKVDNRLEKPIWHSFAFFDTLKQAKERAAKDIRITLERNEKKNGIAFAEEDVKMQLADIQVITLQEIK
jgi:uncharacterized cysteine cluster protein YcgN (CxxCxxCC family)